MKDLKCIKNIKERMNSINYMQEEFKFRPINVTCKVIEDFAKKQFDFLHEHFIYGTDDIRNKFESMITVFYDDEMYQMISREIKSSKIVARYRAFREHTNTEYHMQYNFSNATIFFAEHWKNVYIIKFSEDEFILIGKNLESLSEKFILYMIRELIIRWGENSNLIMMHAASLKLEGKSILLTGQKGAGKTTALCYFSLGSYDCKVIGNDRTFLEFNDDEIKMHYFPLIYRIGYGTVKSMPFLEKWLINKYKDINSEKVNILINEIETKSKFSLNLGEFGEVFNRESIASGRLDAIIVPKIVKNSNILSSRLLSKEEAKHILLNNCFTPSDDLFIDSWLVKRLKTEQEMIEFSKVKIAELLERVPVIGITYGTNINKDDLSKLVLEEIKNIV